MTLVVEPGPLEVGHAGPLEVGHAGRCNSLLRQTPGARCRKTAGWGTDHQGVGACRLHGGKTPSGVKAGRRKLAERDAARSLADLGYEPVVDPLATLADVAGRAVALSGHFADRVAELDDYRYRSDVDTEQLRAELVLLKDFMTLAGKLAADLAKLGFEERRIVVDEAKAGLMAIVLAGVLRELGHDPEADAVLGVLDRWLPVLDGAQAPVIDVQESG